MASIRQNPLTHPLPDWRNLGILLRILLGANLAFALSALVLPGNPGEWPSRYVMVAAWGEIPLLLTLGWLALLRDVLWRLRVWTGRLAVWTIASLSSALQYCLWLWLQLTEDQPWGLGQAALFGLLLAVLLLYYLELSARAHSPAIVEARLIALNARIRPHFLFNTINTVLSLIRAQPKQAESALETLSDLFRAALRDPGDWLPLSEEISLCRQYLDLEKLRLGERLHINWDIHTVPLDIQIPPLMLQPLVENAVFHGIEPSADGGTVLIRCEYQNDELRIEVSNPHGGTYRLATGHQMALANIRERLALYYDLEGRLDIEDTRQNFSVRITLPCKTQKNRFPS